MGIDSVIFCGVMIATNIFICACYISLYNYISEIDKKLHKHVDNINKSLETFYYILENINNRIRENRYITTEKKKSPVVKDTGKIQGKTDAKRRKSNTNSI